MNLPWYQATLDGVKITTSLTTLEAETLASYAIGRAVLEIGSAYGYSTCSMGRVAHYVTAIDPHSGYGELPDSYNEMQRAVRQLGLANIEIVRAKSQDVEINNSYSMVFIDGDHRREAVEHDIQLAKDILPEGGVLCLHDYGEDSCPDVKEVLDELFPEGPDELNDTLWMKQL